MVQKLFKCFYDFNIEVKNPEQEIVLKRDLFTQMGMSIENEEISANLIIYKITKCTFQKYNFPFDEGMSFNFKNVISVEGLSQTGIIEREIVDSVTFLIQGLGQVNPEMLMKIIPNLQMDMENLRLKNTLIEDNYLRFFE